VSAGEFGTSLFADTFVTRLCTACSSHAALFVVPGEHFGLGPGTVKFLGLCPSCVAKRIAEYRTRAGVVPDWLSILEREARREIAAQGDREKRMLEVSWDDLNRCHGCGRFIHARDTRYRSVPIGPSPSYCVKCYEGLE
jgi:hypothetical protein